ncbi:MAG: hypothetical protein HQL66_01500 [Magnetococcales bacterium]|nr:hypothetical protein [Magnetococcales bacterium]
MNHHRKTQKHNQMSLQEGAPAETGHGLSRKPQGDDASPNPTFGEQASPQVWEEWPMPSDRLEKRKQGATMEEFAQVGGLPELNQRAPNAKSPMSS